MPDNRATGNEGELQGVEYLRAKGFDILDRNFRTPYGELDVVARKKDEIIFVEVKYRRSLAYGMPYEAVNRRKQDHIVRSALHYLKVKGLMGAPLRFDVLSIGPGPQEIELIPNAFTVPPRYTY